MALPKLSASSALAPPDQRSSPKKNRTGLFSTSSEWLLQDSRQKFSSASPPSSGVSAENSLPKMSLGSTRFNSYASSQVRSWVGDCGSKFP